MFLKSIHLKNFKCFDDLGLSFEEEDGSIRKWTLLLGENGTGKSAILKAIALVTCGSNALSDLLVEPGDWVRYGEEECLISAVLETQKNEEREISLRIRQKDSRKDLLVRNEEGLELLDRALQHSERSYFVIGFGASRRLSLEETMTMKTSRFQAMRARNVATIFDPEAFLRPLESWAMDLDYRREEGIGTVREALDDFLPGVRFHQIDKDRRRLLFETPDGIVPLHSLSDGYQSVAAWIGDLLYRVTEVFEDYKSPLEAGGLLLIDEVDLHLHPRWQRELLSFLGDRLPNFQLVVTTHSPMTAQQAGTNQLHYIRRQGVGHIEIEQFSGDPRSLLISQLLMTDIFGIESDESLEVQEKKERYRELRDKETLSDTERTELEELKTYLSERPVVNRPNVPLQEGQIELIQQIQKKLRGGS